LTGFEGALQALGIEIPSDEDETCLAFLVVAPGTLVVSFDDHVDALHDETVGIVRKRDDALEAQNVRSVDLRGLFQPWKKLLWIHLSRTRRERFHACIMNGRRFAVMVMMPVIMIVVVMIVIAVGAADMIGVILIEEVRVIVEHTLQVEGAPIEHFG